MSHSKNYKKNKHLIGKQINGWTILDILTDNNKHHTFALAQCQCGTIKEVRLTYIINNRVKGCGCGHQKRLKDKAIKKYEHLINTQINDWTILEIILLDDKHHSTFVICRCKCGTVKEVRLTYIINGRSKDCGCGRKRHYEKHKQKILLVKGLENLL